jgi:hypothetical protein
VSDALSPDGDIQGICLVFIDISSLSTLFSIFTILGSILLLTTRARRTAEPEENILRLTGLNADLFVFVLPEQFVAFSIHSQEYQNSTVMLVVHVAAWRMTHVINHSIG